MEVEGGERKELKIIKSKQRKVLAQQQLDKYK